MSTPSFPSGVRRLRERRVDGGPPLHIVDEWSERFPWLVQGTTGRGEAGGAGEAGGGFDLGLFGAEPVGQVVRRWRELREAVGARAAVHGHQVHETSVAVHAGVAPGLHVLDGVDGHVTGDAGILLAVAIADCVPVSIVDPGSRRVALLHGGWRGTAGEILAAGLERLGGTPPDLHAHLGPAICGECYEVGPEVHEALGLTVPDHNTPVDVRAVQARQLVSAGVAAERISVSEHCTRCGEGFFSHRGGSSGRQVGVLGILE